MNQTIEELGAAYRDGTRSPREVVAGLLEGVTEPNDRYNFMCLVDPDRAMREAAESERRWLEGRPLSPIDGIPTTVKDLIDVAGWPTRRGSLTSPRDPCAKDAPAVASLREAGVVFLGKTTTPEFGWKAVTDCALTGVTRNPIDPSLTPGGSSGGAAVAALIGFGLIHLGTDGAGSVRIPAAFTDVFGFKASFGAVPAAPHSRLGGISHVGPLARTVADAEVAFRFMTTRFADDWHQVPFAGLESLARTRRRTGRIAFARRLFDHCLDPRIGAAFDDLMTRIARSGFEIEEVELPLGDIEAQFVRHYVGRYAFVVADYPPDQRALIDAGLIRLCADHAVGARQVFDAEVRRQDYADLFETFFQTYDFFLTPQMPIGPFEAGKLAPEGLDGLSWFQWSPYTYLANFLQSPAASLPCGFVDERTPFALQVMGRRYDDLGVLDFCRGLEAIIGDRPRQGDYVHEMRAFA